MLMVSQVGTRWHTIYPSLATLDKRLEKLGMEYRSSRVYLADLDDIINPDP